MVTLKAGTWARKSAILRRIALASGSCTAAVLAGVPPKASADAAPSARNSASVATAAPKGRVRPSPIIVFTVVPLHIVFLDRVLEVAEKKRRAEHEQVVGDNRTRNGRLHQYVLPGTPHLTAGGNSGFVDHSQPTRTASPAAPGPSIEAQRAPTSSKAPLQRALSLASFFFRHSSRRPSPA